MKKQLKTYSVMGQISCSMVFRLRSLRIRVNFDGGSLTSQGIVPAVYKTSDTLIQHIIESSEKYKKGFIELKETIDLEEDLDDNVVKDESDLDVTPASVNNQNNTTKESEVKEYPETTNFQSARSIMMNEHKIKIAELQTKEQLLEKAKEIGVSFPNMK